MASAATADLIGSADRHIGMRKRLSTVLTRLLGPALTLVPVLGAVALAQASLAQLRGTADADEAIARLAHVSGSISYSAEDHSDRRGRAFAGLSLGSGDRLTSEKESRVELELSGATIYLAPESDLGAINLALGVRRFWLYSGSCSIRTRQLDADPVEVDTPNASVTLDPDGDYRVDVDRWGNTRVLVRRGQAYVAAGRSERPATAGTLMVVDGPRSPTVDLTSIPSPDAWDEWVMGRVRRAARRENTALAGR